MGYCGPVTCREPRPIRTGKDIGVTAHYLLLASTATTLNFPYPTNPIHNPIFLLFS